MPSDEDDNSFNDAMNEWASKQSFFQNTRNRFIHPDPSLPVLFRITGYLFRLSLLGLLLFGGFLFIVKKHVNGAGFGEMMSEKIAALIGADEYEGRSFVWKGNRATTKVFKATGSDDAFFKKLQATNISFRIPRNRLFNKSWKIEDFNIGDLDMTLRVGSKTDSSAAKGASDASEALLAAGFGIDPDLGQLRFDEIDVGVANLNWGVSDTTKGSILGAPALIKREGNGWSLALTGGELSQNWWNGVNIKRLDVGVGDTSIALSNGELEFREGGEGTLAGEIKLGATPQVDLQMSVKETRLEGLIPPDFHRYLGGVGNASISVSGSPNHRDGLRSKVTLEIVEGRIRNIPAFEALSLMLESTRVRHVALAGGHAEFETGGGVWKVTEFELESEGVGRLLGSFTVSEAEAPEVPLGGDDDPLAGLDQPVIDKPLEERWIFKGSLRFGVPTPSLTRVHPASAKFFTADGAGMSWIDIELDGPITEVTQKLHDEIIAAMRR